MAAVLMTDEEDHLLSVRTLVDLAGAEAFSLKDGDANTAVVLPWERIQRMGEDIIFIKG